MITNQALGKSEAASFKPKRIHFILYTSLSTINTTLIIKKCSYVTHWMQEPVIPIHVSDKVKFQVLKLKP